MLECPNCGELLTPLTVKTSGGSLVIDHCVHCGGSWFDPYEINRINTRDVILLGQNLLIKKKDAPWGKMERLCPRDFHELKKEKTDITQENITLERCPDCHGIFIMQENLSKLKVAQESKIATYKKLSLPFSLTAVFIPFVFISLLMFSTFMTITNLSDAQNSQIKAREELQAIHLIPTSDTATLLFLTQSQTTTSIVYGTNLLDQKSQNINTSPSKTHQTTLKNLKPETLYTYQIVIHLPGGQTIRSKAYNFNTK